jgi:hypothetical protein
MPPQASAPNRNHRSPRAFRRLLGLTLLLTPLTGCGDRGLTIAPHDPELAAYVALVMPQRIEIQRYLTRPVSLNGDAKPDGIEVILAPYDAANDLTKVVGTFHFELETRRMSEALGTRIGFWEVPIDTHEQMSKYRDHLSRFYRFQLKLDHAALRPGRYKLIAALQLPTGTRIEDVYEFAYDGDAAATARVVY